MRISIENNRFILQSGVATLWLEPWGENAFRLRQTMEPQMDQNDWALTEPVKDCHLEWSVEEVDTTDPGIKARNLPTITRPGRYTL